MAAAKAKTTKASNSKKIKTKTNSKSKALQIGQSIPDFKIPSTSGGDFRLSDLKGQKCVLYFYPKDATSGCTLEGNEFNGLLKKFEKEGVQVFGISRDSLRSHDNFREKMGYKFDLLSDAEEVACEVFDVIKEKNMYGKKVMGIERSTFLIDEKGRLMAEWRKVSPPGHAQAVLDRVREG